MTERPGSHDLLYVHSDIPAGMTIREWRAQRIVERRQDEARSHRQRLRLLRVLRVRSRLRRVARAIVWRHGVRHSSGAHGSIST
jgi:hypothetical protein